MRYLLDTCVISELVSKQPDQRVLRWIDEVDDQLVYLSVITIGEIKRGIDKLPESHRRETLDSWLSEDLLIRFEGRVLTINIPVIFTWGSLVARLESLGRPIPAIDSLIAAIALHHELQLVTRNEKDFAGIGLTIVNPWSK